MKWPFVRFKVNHKNNTISQIIAKRPDIVFLLPTAEDCNFLLQKDKK